MAQNDKDRSSSEDPRDEQEILEQTATSPEEEAEIERLMQEIRGDRSGTIPYTLRRIGYWAAGLALIAIVVLTFVLVQKVPFSTRIYGPSTLVPGEPISYRIALFHRQSTSFLKKIQVEMWLQDNSGNKTALYKGKSTRKTLAANFQIPASVKTGNYKLHVDARGPKGREHVIRNVKVVKRPPFSGKPRKSYPNYAWISYARKSSPYLIRMVAEGRTMLADLPNVLHFQVLTNPRYVPPAPTTPDSPDGKGKDAQKTGTKGGKDASKNKGAAKTGKKTTKKDVRHRSSKAPLAPAGTPQRATPPTPRKSLLTGPVPVAGVQVTLVESKRTLGPFTTDSQGFVRVPYVPNFFRVRWKVQIKGEKGSSVENADLKTEGYEVAVTLKKVVVPAGKPLSFKFDSISTKGTFHVDLLQKGRRVWSQEVNFKGGNRHVNLTPPAHLKGLCTLQVYTEFYMPGEVYDARLIYIGNPSKVALKKALREHLVERGDGLRTLDLQAFASSLFSMKSTEAFARRVFAFSKARFFPPQRLYDSAQDKLKKLQQYRGRFRARTLVLLAVLASLVFLLSVGGMLYFYRKEAAAIRAVEQETGEVVQSRGLPYLLLFSLLLFAFFSVAIYLLWIMKFSFDLQ